jgi:hypothetical protein
MSKPHRPFWFHPLLFAIFPALSMLAANVDQVPLSQGFRILVGSLLAGALIYLGALLVLRRWGNAALVASLVLVVLLSYGRLYDGLKAVGLSGETIVRHRYLIPVCLVLVGMGVVWCARRRETAALNRVLNVVSLVAIAFPLVGIASYHIDALGGGRATQMDCTLRPPSGQPLPDVYIIIMDAYERDDVLREFHGFDNSPFLDSLEEMGFYVARGSLSNYRHTELSLSTLLNMEYLEDFPELFGTRPSKRSDIVQLINHGRVRQELECLGYLTVAFETGCTWTEWSDADYYLRRETTALGKLGLGSRVNRLEYLFLKTTVARAVMDGWTVAQGSSPPAAFDHLADHRARTLYVFDELPDVPDLPSPKLVFVHILSPHPPFVFGPNGESVSAAEFETASPGPARESPLLEAYTDQLTYLNARLMEDIEAILANSDPQPIILLMGDHGWADRDIEDKHSILNAYLVPPEAAAQLNQTITPVNSFRVIFDAVFGGSYGRLPDVSYYSTDDAEFEFVIVPNTWTPGSP